VPVEGTPLGSANLDIEHLVHLIEARDRLGAIVNLLLEGPSPTLIFARTRAGVAELAGVLADAGFSIAMLSGEMEQTERNRALASFKRGHVDALVATDVAARGIDVQDVGRVLHAEPPDDADSYTHRSGRTGRAGKKGTSSVLVTKSELSRVSQLLGRARVRFRFAPVPSAEAIRDARDDRMLASLTADFVEGEAVDERSVALAERILSSPEPTRAVARLVALANRIGHAEPRHVTPVAPPEPPSKRATSPRTDGAGAGAGGSGAFVSFRVSWGFTHGADARRLVAMMCRRGKIDGRDIGAIRVGRTSSVVEVSERVALAFEEATRKPDPRDPRVHVRRWLDEVQAKPTKVPPARPSKPAKKSPPSRGGDAPPKRRKH
jgi:ATP-dependent RNA helicase DeaD